MSTEIKTRPTKLASVNMVKDIWLWYEALENEYYLRKWPRTSISGDWIASPTDLKSDSSIVRQLDSPTV